MRPLARLRSFHSAIVLVAAFAVAVSTPAAAAGQGPARFLAKEDILLYGLGLKVEPAQQTVPKDIATIVGTFLQAPQLPDNLPAFAADAEVVATLRGPSLPQPIELHVKPNSPFHIPPLGVAGTHTLDNIRLVSNGVVLLRGIPESTRIDVIDKLLVTQVTARALSAQEIREKGIVFDKANFQAYNFAAAFAIEDHPININFTVVLPSVLGAEDVGVSKATLATVASVPSIASLKTIIPDTLKLQTQIPNLTVVGFALTVPELSGQSFSVPPIPGVIVIPGDIGFLNQYFSVMLMVSNAAPGGSHLVVTGLRATIVLPPGRDGVVGTPDDPLAMARVGTGESPRIQPVVQLGADGIRGTSDDVDQLAPQESGNAEYLVEGRREGSHVVEMQITGTLEGLPIGPVTVTGRAAGSVLVRHPKFTLTFTHPEVVNAGEPYSLDVTVTNTSEAPANFVSVSLHGQHISGATLIGDATKEIESIPPGDSATIAFDLISKLTGRVTAATLDADENIGGRFELKTSVGELGVPLSPDSLVLPPEANGLPKPLRTAAIGLLGKAYAVATAPAAALPPDIRRFSRQIVIDGAVQVAEAGLRVTLHEPIPDSALQLEMDFAGSDYARLPAFNPKAEDLAFAQNDRIGFDELRRKSVRGDAFAGAVAAVLADSVGALGVSGFHRQMAEKIAYRPGHVSVIAGGAGPMPFTLTLRDGAGRLLGGTDPAGKVLKQIPFSDLMTFSTGGAATAALALVTTPDPGDYLITLDPIAGAAPAAITLSVVVPGADGVTLRHIVFENVGVGSTPAASFAAGDPIRFTVQVGGADAPSTALAASSDAPIVEPPPAIVSVVQQPFADALKCDAGEKSGVPVGRIVAVLFSKEVTPDSAQDKARAEDITNYTLATNRVVGAALQPGRRIVYLALRDPVGPYVPEDLTIAGLSDVHGHAMPAQTLPIETTVDAGGVVSGRVLKADGTPVPNANVRLFYLLTCDIPHWVGISSKWADADGRYSWNLVGNVLPDRIVAVDEETGEFRDVRFSLQRSGQRLTVDIVLLGRGTLQGRTLSETGAPLRDSAVRVTSLTDQSQYAATTDADGRFSIARIPVGNILIEAVNVAAKARTFVSQAIPTAGSTTFAEFVLLTVETTQVTLKTGTITGTTLAADGVTPITGVPVIAWYQSNSQPQILCPPGQGECAVAVVNSDRLTGAYRLDGVTAGTIRLQTFDQASLQQGEARVILPLDGTAAANILLSGGVGTVRGSVLDALGQPVAGARVGGGLSLATSDAAGRFTLADVPVGHREIVAVSDALGVQGTVGIDVLLAGETIGATIVLPSTASVAGTVFEADRTTAVAGVAVYLFARAGSSINVVGTAVTDAGGHYRLDNIPVGDYQASAFRADFSDGNIRAVPLKFFRQVARGDIVFRGGGGRITGAALDADGHTPLKAAVSISGDQLVIAGGRVGVEFKYVQNYKVTQTDFTTGRYQFGGIWVGKATISAAGQFSPDPVSLDATIPAANALVTLDIRLRATSRLTGTVYLPDGATPAGQNLIVTFRSDEVRVVCSEGSSGEPQCTSIPQGIQQENVVTDEHGEFVVPVVNAGVYTVSVEDPVSGQIGIAHGSVRAAEEGHVTVRLLGRGIVTVVVRGSDGVTPIPAAKVVLEQTDYPKTAMTVITDAAGATVFSGGDSLTEGSFTVIATDLRNGFAGRASGKVTRDGEQVTVTVYLYDAWGTVTGHVFRPDGVTTVPFSDVVVSNAAGALALGITDATGSFLADFIPIGPVFIETFEAATARVGSASGRVQFARQTVPVDVVESALGVVKGILLQSGSLTPLKGWEVSLSQVLPSGRSLPTLRTTTSIDGSFSFPGASEGLLSLRAAREGISGTASAQVRLTREGQVVEVPLLVTLATPLTGSVIGKVYNADGTPGADTLVQVCQGFDCGPANGVTVTAAADGTFAVDNLSLGRFLVRARSQVTSNSGTAIGEIRFDGETAGVTVALKGLSTISGTVLNGDGSVAAGARLELTGVPSSDCIGPCVQFALPDGSFRFTGVSASSFSLVATGAVSESRGIAGDRLLPGETKAVVVRLEPFGQLAGRVLLPGGAPAANIVAELVFGLRHFFAQSGADGRFAFAATPLGAYALTLQDPIGEGIVSRTGTISGATVLADAVLDTAPPAVIGVSPAPAAVGVARAATVQITFSEPIDPGTATQANITVSDGVRAIDGTLQTGNGDTTVTFRPLALLKDETRFTVRVADIRDRVGKTLTAAYVTAFTTVDITPPRPLALDPAPSTTGVAVDAAIRVKYSEAIDPARFRVPPIAIAGSGGAVAGRIDYLFGNTTVVFTPNRPLADGASYQVLRAAATDAAGNVEAAPAAYAFTTTDRTPPAIAALAAPPSVIENGQAMVVATVGTASDIAVVDFYINGVFALAARTAPFTLTFQAIPTYGKPGDVIRITALATDTSGNRSTAPAAATIAVTADAPPAVAVTVVTPTNALSAHNNDFVTVTVHAKDDLGVVQVGYKALTGNPLDAGTRTAAAALDRTASFSFHVPADAAPGSTVRVQASASDTKGQIGEAVPVDILVLDAIAPTVTITGATTGTMVNPGQQTTIAVLVRDSGGVASITLNVTGVAQFTQTRSVDPPQTAAITSFTITIPSTAKTGDSISIVATAVDRAGNIGTSGNVVMPVADRTPPTVHLHTDNFLTEVGAGTPLVIVADADDDLAVAVIDLTVSGAFTLAQSRTPAQAVANAHEEFRFDVPASVPDGATITLVARATDHAGNVSPPATLTLTVRSAQTVVLPGSVLLKAGESAIVSVDIPGGARSPVRVDFTTDNADVATVTPSVQFAAGEISKTFVVTGQAGGTVQIGASLRGVPSATMTVVVRGGIITGFVVDDRLRPVGGADVIVSGGATVATVSAANGSYTVEGINGPDVTVRATDPATHLYGFTTGTMSRYQGFADISVVMTTAASISGTVFESDAQTPAGGGVRVDIYESTDMSAPRSTVFTDAAGAYTFPFVQLGQYVLDATGHNGERARATIQLEVSAQQATVPLSFLGHGVVVGTVIGGLGQPVNAAAVEFHAWSVVGSAPDVLVTTDGTGTFRIEGVLVGQFWLTARDATTGQAGSISGVMNRAGDTVTANVHLAAYATLAGTVYRADRTTTVAGATVTTSTYRRTTTDEAGRYQFDLLPLGAVSLRVDDGSARGVGVASTTMTTAGGTQALDVVLFAQGSVVVTVLDASGVIVPNANVYLTVSNGVVTDGLYVRAGVNGVAVIDHVLAGTFDIRADNGVLKGSTLNRHVAAGEVQQVTVRLQPTGGIAGIVAESDGLTPASGGHVDIRFSDFNVLSTPIADDGTYHFDLMPLDAYGYELNVYDAAGRFRAFAKAVPVTHNGVVVTKNFTFVGLGQVRGQVKYAATGGTAADFSVTVQTRNPDFTAAHSAVTNAAGFYEINDVPVGPFTASTGNLAQQLWGEGDGALAHGGDVAEINILLQNNAIALPATRSDANNFSVDVQPDGTLGSSIVFNEALALDIVVSGAPHRFTGGEVPTAEQSGREIVTRQNGLAGLNVTRKLFVPLTGYFARALDFFSNPTADPITVDVQLTTELANGMIVRSTSSGDVAVSVADAANPDRWVAFDDSLDGDPALVGGRPAAAFVFDGAGARTRAATVSVAGTPSRLQLGWTQIVVPPGGAVALLHFAVQQTSRFATAASTDRLVRLAPEALEGMTPDEIAAIVNFAVPADGHSIVAALPALTGSVSGHVFEADGSTPAPFTRLTFKSGVPVFGRTQHVGADAIGAFSFTSAADDGASHPIPLDTFTLAAQHPLTGVASPSIAGGFGVDDATAQLDVVFNNTAMVSGTVRRHNGVAVTTGFVRVSLVLNGPVIASAAIGSDARYRVAGLLPGTYVLSASIAQQGSALLGIGSVTVTAGAVATADVTIEATGSIAGTLSTANGTPVPGVVVNLGNSVGSVSREARTDTGGVFTFSDVPAGVVSLSVTDPTTGLRMSAPATVVVDAATPVALKFPAVGRLEVQVNFQRGVGAASVALQLQEAVRGPDFRGIGATDAAGHKTMTGLSAGTFVVRAAHPNNTRIVVTASGTLTDDGSAVPVAITLPAAGTVSGLVTDAHGAVAGIAVTIRSTNAAFGGFQTATTDAAGAYVIAGVPDGGFTATVQEFGRQLFGEASGRVDADGQNVTVSISLTNNAVSLPADRHDANGLLYHIEPDGRISQATNGTFGYYWMTGAGASRLEIVSNGVATAFTGSNVGTVEQDGREIVVRQAGIAGLSVTRKVFVPRAGYFARYVELLTNPGTTPVTVDLRVNNTVIGLSSASQSISGTSSGDATLDLTDAANPDRWVTFDDVDHVDAFRYGRPMPTAFVFDGMGAARRVSSATTTATVEQSLAYVWRGITVPAGQTVGVMHYIVEQPTAAGATAAATRLSLAPPEALDGLSPEELAAIQNFALPADGASTLDPLPSLTGSVAGRVLGSDKATPIPYARMTFTSQHPLFGRTWPLQAGEDAAFSIKGRLDDNEPMAVPVAPFTLHASHPQTYVEIDQPGDFSGTVTGNLAFALGEATASSSTYSAYYPPQNAIDDDTNSFWYTETIEDAHWFDVSFPTDVTVSSVTMLTDNLLSADIDLLDAAGGIVATVASVDTSTGTTTVSIDGEGVRRVRVTDPSHRSGIRIRDLRIFGSAPASAGAARQDVVFSNTGTLVVTIHKSSGALAAYGDVQVNGGPPLYVGVNGSVTGGEGRMTGLPTGSYSVAAQVTANAAYSLRGSATASVTAGATSTVDVTLEPTGTVRGRVTRANGAPSAGSFVRLERSYPFFAVQKQTDTDGRYVFEDVPLNYYTLTAYEPATNYRTYGYAYLTTPNQVFTQDFTLIGLGTIRLHVQYANGAPAAGSSVLVSPAWSEFLVTADMNGDATAVNVVEGAFRVRARHPLNDKLATEISGVIAGDGDSQQFTIVLPPAGAITGTVTRPDGTPVQYPDVTVDVAGVPWGPDSIDFNGQFGFNALPAGQPLTVRAYWPYPYPRRLFYGETPFTATDGASEVVDVRLPGFATITVHVTRGDGVTPWAGAAIFSSDKFRPFFQVRGRTDANGNLTLQRSLSDATPEQFAEGDVTIRVYDANTGVALFDQPATVRYADINGNVDVAMGATIIGGNITGHVYARDGTTPIPDAYVELVNAVDAQRITSVYAGPDGAFEFPNVLPGQQGVVVRATAPIGWAVVEEARTFTTAGETLTVDLLLPVTPATVSGHVFAGDGLTPLTTVEVLLIDSQGNGLQYAYPDAIGAYSFGLWYFDAPGFSVRGTEYSVSGISATVSGTIPSSNAQVTVDLIIPISIVSGRVRFADGTNVRRASMFVTDSTGVTRNFRSNTDGTYNILNLAPGEVVVTAQDNNSGLNATATGTLQSVAAALALDVRLPASGTVTGFVTDASGAPVRGASVILVSPNLEFQRFASSSSNGSFTFTRVPVGSVYVQTAFYDGTDYRYVAATGEVIADATLTLGLAWHGGGTVAGVATAADGGPAGEVLVAIRAFAGMGPNGLSTAYVFSDSYSFADIPPGRVQVAVYAMHDGAITGSIGLVDGEVTAGSTLTLNVALGNAVDSTAILDGDDGFRYDVSSNGILSSGGTADGRLRDAFSGADYLQVNGLDFPTVDAARPSGSGRALTYGPVPMPTVLATRSVYVPQTGGFARYLETLTNPTTAPQTITVGITGDTGGLPRVLVAASTTGNTFTVTDFPDCDCTTSTLGRVFQGAGTPPLPVATSKMTGSHFVYTYQLTLAPGAAATIMHFEVQRDTSGAAAAEAQARALVDLSDPHALDGMTDAERAQVVNFVIPR
ncbi:MAG: LamG domain protein jellyroll fold domain protein [Acidobacteria bacterium]|nr:LamG domain protein jellyroll fold domain protein [Acidobacteriota bacterium]